MPYRLGVYEDKNGKVFIAGAKMWIMGKMFGRNAEKVMGKSAKKLVEAFLKFTK